jgi:hypothetical protein
LHQIGLSGALRPFVLHPGRIRGPRNETATLVEAGFPARAEQLNIADAGCSAPLDQPVQNCTANATILMRGQNDHIDNQRVQDAVRDNPPEPRKTAVVKRRDGIPTELECFVELVGVELVFLITSRWFERVGRRLPLEE